MVEMGLCVNGYWADITRTGQTGQIDVQHKQIFYTVLEAQQKAIAAMKPGVRMGEIDKIARKHIEAGGYGKFFNHALGHHVGFRYHDFGPTLSPGSDAVLEEGMVLTVEPGIYIPANSKCDKKYWDIGVRIEDDYIMTDHGADKLSKNIPSEPDEIERMIAHGRAGQPVRKP